MGKTINTITPKATFKGRVIIKVDNGYLVNGKTFKSFEKAADSLK